MYNPYLAKQPKKKLTRAEKIIKIFVRKDTEDLTHEEILDTINHVCGKIEEGGMIKEENEIREQIINEKQYVNIIINE